MSELGARGIGYDLVLGSTVLTFRRRGAGNVVTIPLGAIASLRLRRASRVIPGELQVDLLNSGCISVCFTRTHSGDFERIHEVIRNTLAATPAMSSPAVGSAWRAS
ncbi:hypothetical protein ACPZ19_41010 [Amycolatopsis lurida]